MRQALVSGPGFGNGEMLHLFLDDGRGSRQDPHTSGDLSLGVDCGANYAWRVRTVRGSLLHPPAAGLDGLGTAAAAGADLGSASSAWTTPWTFSVPEVVEQAPTLLSPAEGASISGGRLEWSHPLYPAEPLRFEVDLTTDPGTHQQSYWVFGGARSPSLRDADRARLSEPYFPVMLGSGQTMYWRVRASRAEGLCAGPWSGWRSFLWTGPTEGLGSLPPPTCISDAEGRCFFMTATIAPTVSRTPRPTATATPTASATLPALPGPGLTLMAPSSTDLPATKTLASQPTDTEKAPQPTKKPTEKATQKPTDKPPEPTEPPKK